MSNRTLLEFNHDYCPRRDKAQDFANALITYMRSGDKSALPDGVSFVEMRHHSEPSLVARAESLSTELERVKKYARHLPDCKYQPEKFGSWSGEPRKTHPCTCGFKR